MGEKEESDRGGHGEIPMLIQEKTLWAARWANKEENISSIGEKREYRPAVSHAWRGWCPSWHQKIQERLREKGESEQG